MTRHASTITIDRERFPIDTWGLVETSLGLDDGGLTGTLFATGNGYLGMRGDWAPDPESSGTYVNGFHETFPIIHAEHAFALARTGQSLLNAPEAKSIELAVGDEVLRLSPGHPERSQVTDFRREIDFRTGVLRSQLTWHTRAGGRVRVVSERIVSMEHRHLAVLRLSLELLDATAAVTITSRLVNRQDVAVPDTGPKRADPRRSRAFDRRVLEPVLQTHADPGSPGGGTLVLGYRCVGSGMTIAAAHRHAVDAGSNASFDSGLTGDLATTTMRLDAGLGDTVTLTKYVAYHTSSQIPDAADDASVAELAARCRSTLGSAEAAGWEQALAEQRAWLDRFWARTDIAVDGDDAAQQAIRWNLFQMAQASAQIGGRGIAAKAVTAAGYDGHYFWDTEVYMVPLLAYTNPEAARELLHFRHRTLPTARQRAIEMSQRGALYPWRTINGEEASAYYPAGTAQYHINADVAHAIDRYVTATGDTEFLRGEGAEILVELARLFTDLGFYDQGDPAAFHIHGVTGPDEYTAVVDDNVYTNVMARFTLRFASDVVTRLQSDDPDALRSLVLATGLGDDEVAAWSLAANSMCVLYDADLGINPQDDAFLGHEAWDWAGTPDDKYPLLLNFHPLVIYRHQVLKQADVVLATFLRSDEFAPDLQRRNFDYYDPITTGDSSLSACVQSIIAAEVGHAELAVHYFRESLFLDIADTHGNTVDGAHIANVGGVWACLVHGFAGVRDSGSHVRIAPRLPAGWQGMRFRLHRRGGDIAIVLDPTGATVTVESGEPVPILADGVVTEVASGGSLRVAGDSGLLAAQAGDATMAALRADPSRAMPSTIRSSDCVE
ncbi:MAG: glycosyl hydrolase family 65 protein [Ilumatobacteraceae bacterium]